FTAMGPMLIELAREPEVGLLHARTVIDADLRGLTVVQYWRSIEDIYRYANDGARKHRPAWLAFYRRAHRVPGAVQVWHESYAVRAGGHESLHAEAPRPFGLAGATGSVAAARRGRSAKERLRNRVTPEPEAAKGRPASQEQRPAPPE